MPHVRISYILYYGILYVLYDVIIYGWNIIKVNFLKVEIKKRKKKYNVVQTILYRTYFINLKCTILVYLPIGSIVV